MLEKNVKRGIIKTKQCKEKNGNDLRYGGYTWAV